MSIQEQYKQERDQLQMFLGEIGDLLEHQSGFVQRHSRFGGNELIQTMTLGCLENGMASLESFSQIASELGSEISASGIHQRLNTEAVELLREVCQIWTHQKMKINRGTEKVFSAFAAVRIIDSSRIQLHDGLLAHFPGSRHGATLKTQLSYEYHSGQIEVIEVEPARCPDQKCDLPQTLSAAGDLVLFDLGYFDQKRFAELDERGIYFLSRLQSQAGLYDCKNPQQAVDLLQELKQLPDSIVRGERHFRLGSKQKLPVRVVYYRVPPAIAQERRRKAKQTAKEQGRTCSQHHLDWQDWLIFITNVPVDLLQVDQISVVYRVRWQIEILFKVWKQELDWGKMGNWRLERVLCQFYGRCLALLLFHQLVAKYQAECNWELSWQKAIQRLKRKTASLIDIVRLKFRGLFTFLTRLDSDFRRFARKSRRRKSLSTYELLQLVGA